LAGTSSSERGAARELGGPVTRSGRPGLTSVPEERVIGPDLRTELTTREKGRRIGGLATRPGSSTSLRFLVRGFFEGAAVAVAFGPGA
jgi:hypothetical protein